VVAKSTIREHVAVLRALLGDAMEEGLIRSNLAAGVRVSVPEGDGTGRALTEEKRANEHRAVAGRARRGPARGRLSEGSVHTLSVRNGLAR